jgi:hypothetical protein
MGDAGRLLDLVAAVLLFRRVGDVAGHGVVEQVHVLGDQGVLLAQLAQAVFADVDAVQQDFPLFDVIEAGQRLAMVLLPEPERPTRATDLPASTLKLMLRSAGVSLVG